MTEKIKAKLRQLIDEQQIEIDNDNFTGNEKIYKQGFLAGYTKIYKYILNLEQEKNKGMER